MIQVNIAFRDINIIIECDKTDKIGDILDKIVVKMQKPLSELVFLYNGNIINKDMKFEELPNNEVDKISDKINLLVNEIMGINTNKKIKESEVIVCPECDENNRIKIENYKISMTCKNNHKYVNMSIKDFIYSQKKDKSKYNRCNICNEFDKSNIDGIEMYKCLNCEKIICPICINNHNKNDKIINIETKNVYCKKHYELFNRYCKDCNKNLCMKCEKDHNNHKIISLGDIRVNDYNENEFDKYINKLNDEINDIIKKLNEIKANIKLYRSKSKNIMKRNDIRNYEILNGINEFINYNNKIISDVKKIINEKNIFNKFQYLMNIYNQMNNEDKILNKQNYIISEIIIKKEDTQKKIKIINSYEQFKRETGFKIQDEYKYSNEKEIKDKCEIIINDKKVPFNIFYEFDKEGIYEIKYIFNKQNITNIAGMFYGCTSLTKIDFSNFDARYTTDMSYMFSGCKSLININLSNFNTQNVTDMRCMFYECNNLTDINLSYFNTQNVTDMSCMFSGCKSLTNLNLSNFNTKNTTIMRYMFYECNSLTNVNLSSFNTQNVNNMHSMFYGCKSLTHLNLSDFNTQNVTDMSYMFYGCKSLTNLNLSNFNTQNVNDMSYMLYECNSLTKDNIMTQDYKILKLF